MNFFKSVFSDDPDPPQSESESESQSKSNNADSNHDSGDGSSWDFGGLIQTLTAKSESIIETYRRDLQEFSTGLKSELEVAHDSVGEIRNTVIKGTAQIISQGKDAILAVQLDSDKRGESPRSLDSRRYSRFDAQVRAIQGDVSTYTDVPEDLNEFNEWKLEFSLDGKSEEMEGLLKENDAMESVYKRIVPNTLDHETFWFRYYYKVYKLRKAEDVRARLVRRMSREEEELSWDVEGEEDDDDVKEEGKSQLVTNKEIGGENMEKRVDTDLQIGTSGTSNEGETKRSSVEEVQHISGEEESKEEKRDNLLQGKEKFVEESGVEKSEVVHEMGGASEETNEEAGVDKASKLQVDGDVKKDDSKDESDEKAVTGNVTGEGESSGKNNESSVVDSQHMENEEEEEDLEWDDIEDLSGIDEKKATQSESGSASKDDLRKRLSVAEEEEDLSWDIEDDDDEPAKA